MAIKIAVLTHFPSPYQVELFNGITQDANIHLEIFYIYKTDRTRQWSGTPIGHHHQFLDDNPAAYTRLRSQLPDFDLVIFHYYRNRFVLDLIEERSKSARPWCFWGERVGYHRVPLLGPVYRKWKLQALHENRVPIWGIGAWAVDTYREEFGNDRLYVNFPYFCELNRFKRPKGQSVEMSGVRSILFAGSLSKRKGIDLLAQAFRRVAKEFPDAELRILGAGDLLEHVQKMMSDVLPKVSFAGFVNWNDLPPFFHRANLLCMPSRYDGWGLTLVQGLAAGLPVISTDHTGAALEMIRPGANGWLVRAGDKQSLYNAMREAMVTTGDKLTEYSKNAVATIEDFDIASGVTRFRAAVNKTLECFA